MDSKINGGVIILFKIFIYYILPLVVFFSGIVIFKNKNDKIKKFILINSISACIILLTAIEIKAFSQKYIEYLYITLIFHIIIRSLLSISQDFYHLINDRLIRRVYFIFITIIVLLLLISILFYNIKLSDIFYIFDKYFNLAIIVVLSITMGIREINESEEKYSMIFSKSQQIIKDFNIVTKKDNYRLIKQIITIIICTLLFIQISYIYNNYIFICEILVIFLLLTYLNSFKYELYLFNENTKFILKENQDYVEKKTIR
ncbi:MAG: hypothetical protein K0Q49_1567 [Haloplasmataceae bacterium]|nr:hypothetical protein [Haloplasmataceae bacterium]